MKSVWAGSFGGLLATAPMTLVMRGLHKEVPADERRPLPPEQVTHEVVRQTVGVETHPERPGWEATTWASHFGYGLTCGALYGALAPHLPGPPAAKGVAFGLAVWTGSYLGWLPAAGVRRPATEAPASENALMIAAHVVWGAATGVLADAMGDGRSS